MSSTPSPFIPAALDEADLSPQEFRVFCRICRRGECTESVSKMASALNMHEDTIRSATKTLKERGFINTEKRPGTTNKHVANPPSQWRVEEDDPCENQGGDPSEKEGGANFHPCENQGGDPWEIYGGHPPENQGGASKGYPLEGTPLEGTGVVETTSGLNPPGEVEGIWIGWLPPRHPALLEPIPDDHPARSERHLRYRLAAEWSLDLMLEAEDKFVEFRVPSSVKRKAKNDRLDVLQKWADVFRLLQEQDGFEWDEIRYAIHWLFTQSDWLRNGYIGSIRSLRRKTQSGDRTKFEAIWSQARGDDGYHGPNQPGSVSTNERDDSYRANLDRIDRELDAAADRERDGETEPSVEYAGVG